MQFNSDFKESMSELTNDSFWEGWDAEPVVYDQIAEVKTIDQMGGMNWGQETSLIGHDEPEKIGFAQNHEFRDTGEGYIVPWNTDLYQNGFEITQELMDNWGSNDRMPEAYVSSAAKDMGRRFRQARDRGLAKLFNRGTIAAGDVEVFDATKPGIREDVNRGFIYDGKPFFATDHPLKRDSGVALSNYNAARALTETNLESSLIQMEVDAAKDELNREINLSPNVMLVNPSLGFAASKILNSVQMPGTGNNDINPVYGRLNVIPWRKLTDADAWFLGMAKEGIRFIHRGEPEIKQKYDEFRGRGVLSWSMIDEWKFYVRQWRYWQANNQASA